MASPARAALREQVRTVLACYRLPGFARVVGRVPGAALALRVGAGEASYVLRQFPSHMEPAALRGQLLLAGLLRRAGVPVLPALPTKEGEGFVSEGGRLWALFPQVSGRRARAGEPEDRAALVAAEAAWVRGAARVQSVPEWDLITRAAARFRRRESWAWAVPLDRVPAFAVGQHVLADARASLRPSEQEAVSPLLEAVERALLQYDALLKEQRVAALPHTVTHGNFVPTKLLLEGAKATVLDLEGYSFEPRAADFARTLRHWGKTVPEFEVRAQAEAFRQRAGVAAEEMACIPLLICGYELYYAVGHLARLAGETEEAGRGQALAWVQREAEAVGRYHRDRGRWLGLVLPGGR